MIESILNVATKEIGYHEGKNNYNKFAQELADIFPGLQNQPWCAIFVTWCICKAATTRAIAKRILGGTFTAWTPSMYGALTPVKTPQPGDLFFVNSASAKRINHVGFVRKVYSGYIETVEGNYSDGVYSVRRNYPDNLLFARLKVDSQHVGWTKQGSSDWLYYKDGKPLKGYHPINGLYYYFGDDGVMLKGQKIFPDGTRHVFAKDGELAGAELKVYDEDTAAKPVDNIKVVADGGSTL